MIVGRLIGWGLLLLALMALGAEIVASIEAGEWAPLLLGSVWFELAPQSIQVAQAGIQRYLLPFLWDPVMITLLNWPTWVVLGVPGLLLVLLCRPRKRRRGGLR